jgi:hypothetical protein
MKYSRRSFFSWLAGAIGAMMWPWSAKASQRPMLPLVSNKIVFIHQSFETEIGTRKIIEGVAKFSCDVLSSIASDPEWYRQRIIPAVEVGWIRKSVAVDIDINGRYLRWKIVDMPFNVV